ncbi:MAG: hypothetical protein Q4F72_05695, partial [Desulfovibrionaceae bacterium]|nr:hypothetical protein [Desulfovibrionaceae bacterium]
EDCLKRLARSVGRQRLVRVLWPERCDGRKEFQKAVDSAAEHCGMVLLDAGKKGGGHGTRLDLPALRKIVFPVPWMLAGGMAEDVFADLAAFPAESRPAGLDFNSKLESAPGEKDAALMSALCRRAADFNLAPMPYPD